jgi:hypothetical protein
MVIDLVHIVLVDLCRVIPVLENQINLYFLCKLFLQGIYNLSCCEVLVYKIGGPYCGLQVLRGHKQIPMPRPALDTRTVFGRIGGCSANSTLDRMLGRIGRQDVLDAVPGFIEGVTVVVRRS